VAIVQQKPDGLPSSYFIMDRSGWFRITKQAGIRDKRFLKKSGGIGSGNRSGITPAREE
jgi:hypothetical protein